jgi:hypothetical protein
MLLLDDNIAKYHTLSIRLAPDGFSFFVLNQKENKVVHFQHSPIDIHQDAVVIALNAMRSQELFSFPFQEVRVIIDTPEVTVVPQDLFDDDKKEDLFALNNDIGPNEYVLSNHSSAYDVEVLFLVQKELYAFLNKNFSKIRFVHQLSLMLDQSNKYPDKAQEQLFVSYSEHHFSVVALRNNSLVYHNAFKLIVPDDLIYYFLLVIQELGFDQYASKAVLDGVIDEKVNKLLVIKQYLAQMDFMPLHAKFTYPESVIDAPGHYYSSLFALPFCE